VADLPEIVTRLRREAEASESTDHIGKYLTLYWDDPSWSTQEARPVPYLETREPSLSSASPAAGTDRAPATQPLFFLSYARRPRASDASEQLVARFFNDLSDNVAQLVARAPGASIGIMDQSILGGTYWTDGLLHALGTCQVFIPLISVPYVTSQWCAMEWDAFSRRTVTSATSASAGSPIVPVMWAPISASQIPEPIRSYEWFPPATADYGGQDYGLSGLLQTKQEATYQRLAWQLAQRIADLSHEYHVEEQTPRPEDLRNVFLEA
jgi:TIR domain